MTGTRSLTWRVIAACLVSGIIAGVLTATQCQRAETACQIAALQSLSSEPVPWTQWLHWINWLPGAVFGLLFGLATLQPRPFRILSYTAVSAAIYMAAGLVFSAFLMIAAGDEFSLIVWIWPAGFTSGLLGALFLALAARLFIHGGNSPRGPFPSSWLPAVVGAITGVLFVLVGSYGEQHILLAWPVAFSTWQVAVGLTMRFRIA